MRNSHKLLIARIFCVLICVGLFAAVWNRAHLGLDVTDESYWIAEPYLVLKGAVPFADLWSQTPSTSLLIAPLVAAYLFLTGGTEGIALYFMCAAVLFRLAICIGIWRLLRRQLGDIRAGTFSFALFCCDMGLTKGLNYNNISLYLLALAGALVLEPLVTDREKKPGLRFALAGVLMALCALAHITEIVNCVFFALLFLLISLKRNGMKRCLLPYLVGGLGIALITVVGLEIAGRGQVFSGIRQLLQLSNYFRIGKLSIPDQLTRTFNVMKSRGQPWLVAFLCLLAASMLVSLLIHRGKKLIWRKCLAISVVGAGIVLMAIALKRGAGRDQPMLVLFFAVPLLLAAVEKSRRRQALMMFLAFWVPCFLAWILVAFTSHSPADYRYYILTAGALLEIPLSLMAMEPSAEERENAALRFAWTLWLPTLCLAVLTAATLIKTSYGKIYREAPAKQLVYKVETGIYKGLLTTEEKGKTVERLEELIRENTKGTESILICDLFPMGYLMTDATYCTPTVWDPDMYRYGFQDMALFKAYFDRSGRTPDMILYVNSEDLPLSIDDPENEFAAYVNGNYHCTETIGEGLYSLRFFERNATG